MTARITADVGLVCVYQVEYDPSIGYQHFDFTYAIILIAK